MSRLLQLMAGASTGDAITNSALYIQSLVPKEADGGVYARHRDPGVEQSVQPLEALASQRGLADDVLLLHMSIGEPRIKELVAQRPERLVVYYHNISPADHFEPYDPAFAALLREGRQELRQYLARAELTLAASSFSASELEVMGASSVRVVPLVFDPSRLLELEPDPPTAKHLREVTTGPVILGVGQLLPHKRQDFLVHMYHVLSSYLRPDAHLILVGVPRLRRYSFALNTLVREYGLSRCWMTGKVSDEQLAAFYRRADLYVSASEHEGFAAPLLEALAFGVPVIARRFGAVPETLAGAGLLLDPGDGPAVMAETIDSVLGSPELLARLAESGRQGLEGRTRLPGESAMAETLRELRCA